MCLFMRTTIRNWKAKISKIPVHKLSKTDPSHSPIPSALSMQIYHQRNASTLFLVWLASGMRRPRTLSLVFVVSYDMVALSIGYRYRGS